MPIINASAIRPNSIAILPFVNLSSDPENEYFSDGLTEEIINALTRIEGLQVTARTSSFAFKNKNADVREIGRQLGVAHILEGSVRKSAKKVRITAQLIAVKDGFHLWSESFDRALIDIFDLQDEISLLIADKIRENSLHFDIADRLVLNPGISPEAYELYLRARYLVQRYSKENIERGIALYHEVIEQFPNFAPAYLGIHFAYTFLGTMGLLPVSHAFSQGQPFLDRAVELDPDLPECQMHLAGQYFWQKWDRANSYRHYKKALELRPNYAEVYQWLALVLSTERKFEEALHYINTALQLDPMAAEHHYIKGTIHYFQEDYGPAKENFQKSLSLESDLVFAHVLLGATCLRTGKIQEGLAYFSGIPVRGDADLSKLGGTTLAYAMLGEMGKVAAGLRQLEAAMQSDVMGRALFFRIIIHSTLGEYDTALELIALGISHHLPLVVTFPVEPFLEPLFDHPRFQELMQQILPHTEEEAPFLRKKYQKSPLKLEEMEAYQQQLETYLREEQPYLESDLNLRQLAHMIDLHPNYLSQLLNERIGQNFNEYINSYRLETFKQKVIDPANRNLTLLALAYDSGFNSKTVFNTFFKKTMGMTPRQYYKQVSEGKG
ncbi:MAG: helix-turn-helix domain-containing protein [Saprospiraceae bacterium]|nr:helix-turn-helix domain-containing protein [Lewinella sp.]